MNPENHKVSKYTMSFGWSLALCSVVNALLVIAKEKSHAVLAAMQKLTGHHWVTHFAIIVILFFLFGWLFAGFKSSREPAQAVNRLAKTVIAGVMAGGLIIVGFYLIAG